ncbi:hypothetical protein Patl1_12153 [Pistacia atlantica]|uniref:Uncharacterized protein n=1 Tax=Pistacia atlantica TaxID=434234 RepID=A0ACC1A4W1_9ROSI|nr:hypothetical protein Patl1_12153 [Pistacia atlantica]
MALPFSYTFTSGSSTGSNTGHSAITSPWMDARIWCKLPQRLLDRVLAFLPPPAFFRARAVCKRWYGLLFSNSFLELYIQVSPQHHWFLFFKHKTAKSFFYRSNTSGGGNGDDNRATTLEGYLFDPHEIAWYRVSFAFLPSGFSPACSSGGLICWVSDEAGAKSLILCVKVSRTSIDVAVAGDDLISPYAVKNLSTESFHIDAGGFYSLWGTTSSLPRLCNLESGRMVHVNGKFYCMNYGPFSVLAYDVSVNSWFNIQAPMRRFLRSPKPAGEPGETDPRGGGGEEQAECAEEPAAVVPAGLRLDVGRNREDAAATLCSVCGDGKQQRIRYRWPWGFHCACD